MKPQFSNQLTESEADELLLYDYIEYHNHDGLCELDRARYIELENKKAGA